MPIVTVSIILAIVVGMAISAQTLFSGTLGRHLGVMESVFIIHLGGLLASGLYLLLRGGGNLGTWRSVPWYVLCGGLLGVVIVGGYSYIVPRIGLAPAITLAICAQLVLSAVLSHYGALGAVQQPLSLSRLLGIGVLMLGTWLIVR